MMSIVVDPITPTPRRKNKGSRNTRIVEDAGIARRLKPIRNRNGVIKERGVRAIEEVSPHISSCGAASNDVNGVLDRVGTMHTERVGVIF